MTWRWSLLLALPVVLPAQERGVASPLFRGATLPASCEDGELYSKTGASPGLYQCESNTWDKLAVAAASAVPAGSILMVIAGACPATYTEVSALAGKTLLGTTNGAGDVGGTGGSDTLTPTGTVAAPVFTGTSSQATSSDSAGTPAGTNTAPTFTGSALGTHLHGIGTYANAAITAGTPAGTVAWPAGVPTHSGTAVSDHASHTHTYTDVVNHTHGFTDARGATTGGATTTWSVGVSAADTSSTATGLLTANPGGGVATGTTAGPGAALTHTVSNQGTIAWPAGVPTFAGSALGTHNHTFSGSSEAISAGTPAGTIDAPVFTGSALAGHTHTLTPAGTNSAPAFTGSGGDNRSAFVKVIFCLKD